MHYVSLVCTIHAEVGCANVTGLHAILGGIRPGRVFLEVPPAAFDDHFVTFTRANLESVAVRQYRENHQLLEIIPVDLPTPSREFFEDVAELQIRIQGESPQYRQLKKQEIAHVENYGFAYLNSEHSNKLYVDLYDEMEKTLDRIGDSRLIEIYKSWRKTLSLREDEMLTNIQRYCASSSFERGIFLVGAAHRKYIIDNLQRPSPAAPHNIQWNFNPLLEEKSADKET